MTTGEKKHLFKRTLKYDSKWLDSKKLKYYYTTTFVISKNILRGFAYSPALFWVEKGLE
jgi:hypothetical protein